MSSLGFAPPDIEIVLSTIFFIVNLSLIITVITRILLIKDPSKPTNDRFKNLKNGIALLSIPVVFLNFYFYKSSNIPIYESSDKISKLFENFILSVFLALISLVIIKVIIFLFKLYSVKKLLLLLFILILAGLFYPKKYTSEYFDKEPKKSIVCRCTGIVVDLTCLGFKYNCDTERQCGLC